MAVRNYATIVFNLSRGPFSRPFVSNGNKSKLICYSLIMWNVALEAWKGRRERGSDALSWGAKLFNRMLIVMGVRSPFKKLLHTDATVAQTAIHFFDKFRIYTFLLFVFYVVMPVYHAINLSKTYSDDELINLLSECLIPIQLVLACRYFSTSHIEQYYDVIKPSTKKKKISSITLADIYIDIQQENRENHIEFSVLIKQPCRITIKVVSIIVVFLSTVVFLGSMATMNFSDFSKPFIPFMIISKLLGRTMVVNNTTTFCYVFYKHVKVLNIYADILEHQRWSESRDYRCSILLVNLLKIRESLKISSDLLKSVFSSATIIGSFMTGAFIHSTTIDHRYTYEMIVIICSFVTLQIIFFYVIYRLSQAKSRIEDVVFSSSFASKFLSRSTDYNCDKRISELATTQDWRLITQILKDDWLDFCVMGLPLHSGAFMKQCLTITSSLLLLANSGSVNFKSLFSD